MCGEHSCKCKVRPPDFIPVDIGREQHKNIWAKLWKAESDIDEAVKRVSWKISKDYQDIDTDLVFLIVLKGGTCFANDLLKSMTLPFIKTEYVWCSSYTVRGVPDGEPTICFVGNPGNLRGKSVIIVDDIMDTGSTIEKLFDECIRYGIRDIKTCCLVHKTASKIAIMKPNYVGFEAADLKSEMYLIGYGMDYDEKFRNMESIYWFHKDAITGEDPMPVLPSFQEGGWGQVNSPVDADFRKIVMHEN